MTEIPTPTVTIVNPVNDTDVVGDVIVQVRAEPHSIIRSVDIIFDGKDWKPCTYNSSSELWEYVWNTTRTATNLKTYVIGARATA